MLVPRLLYAAGVRSAPLHVASLGGIALCLSLWIRAKTVDQEERNNAERRAIFVGLWPSMFWLLGNAVAEQTLTDDTLQANSPKYVALKHYARYIRPGSRRAPVTVAGSTDVIASAYVNAANGSLTWVILNGSASTQSITIDIPGTAASTYDLVRSSDGSLWQASTLQPSVAQLTFNLAGYGVATVSGGASDLIFADGFD